MTDDRPAPLVPAERKPLSKRARFDVFKRDSFTCQYCGRKPPAVVLEVDHIVAVSKGGTNEDHNLITSCFDCNRGKADGTLGAVRIDTAARAALLQERLEQAEAYDQLLRDERAKLDAQIDAVIDVFRSAFDGYTLNDSTRPSIKAFLEKLPLLEVSDAMDLACSRVSRDAAFRYFCGVCWRKIKGD